MFLSIKQTGPWDFLNIFQNCAYLLTGEGMNLQLLK